MIITAEGPPSRTGRRYTNRMATLASFDSIAPAQPGADNEAVRRYYRGLLIYAVGHCLTEKQRRAVELYYFDGRRLREMSAMLGVSPSTLSRRLSSARRRIYRFTNEAIQIEKLRIRCGL